MKNVRLNPQSPWYFHQLMFITERRWGLKLQHLIHAGDIRLNPGQHINLQIFFTHLFVKFFAGLFNRHYTVLKSESAVK